VRFANPAARAEPEYDEPEYDESDDGEPDYGDADYVPGPEEVAFTRTRQADVPPGAFSRTAPTPVHPCEPRRSIADPGCHKRGRVWRRVWDSNPR